MKAADFRYAKPSSLGEAIALLADTSIDVMPLAGGQSLMPMMNFRMAQPGLLVDLNGIEGLSNISEQEGRLRIGAMARYRDLELSTLVAEKAPLITQALPHIAHAAIRNRGTIGGSAALADPAAEMPAVLVALDAQMEVLGPDGTRHCRADDFFLGLYETDLKPGELLTAITVPAALPGDRFGFYELARRHGDYAMTGVAIAVAAGGPRIAFFGIGDRPLRQADVEQALASDSDAIDTAVTQLALPASGDLNATASTKNYYAGVVLRRAWTRMRS